MRELLTFPPFFISMFTGIIKGIGKVESLVDKPNLRTFSISLPEGAEVGVELGASISVDGVCLTVTSCQGSLVTFDVMAESLRVTTLGNLRQGDLVNIERAARDGAEIGGHPLSGHIDCICSIQRIERPDNNVVMTFSVPEPFIRYIFSKGYIGLNGTSLTVTNANKKTGTFQVWFIPETLRLTTFGQKSEGDQINLEIERSTQVVVDTVREFLEERFSKFLPQIQALLDHD
jgi:riboflavin synthase